MAANITDFQFQACTVAITKMFSGKHFSICDLDKLSVVLGREAFMSGKDYAALKTLHCVDWGDMGPDLARSVREKCFDLLGIEYDDSIETTFTREPESTQKKNRQSIIKRLLSS